MYKRKQIIIKTMNPSQKKIIDLATQKKLSTMTLKEIGEFIGIGPNKPQAVRHHLGQLVNSGVLKKIDRKYYSVGTQNDNSGLISLPIYGAANCGEATCLANNYIEGYLRVSPGMLRGISPENLFILKADGDSMNRATIGEKNKSIENGDFVVVDSSHKSIDNDMYVVSIIGDCANIKKVKVGEAQISLLSESTKDYPPIIIHNDDLETYSVAGRVIDVIKN
jgi:SOS-response transcriptional repressor LexA